MGIDAWSEVELTLSVVASVVGRSVGTGGAGGVGLSVGAGGTESRLVGKLVGCKREQMCGRQEPK